MAGLSDKRILQRAELEILKEFARICEKHHLRYYITAGTLLGAVRHQGFIPWDDDIDVAMPRADFDKLAGVCRKSLSRDYFYQDWQTERNYPMYFVKIRKNNTVVCEAEFVGVEMHQGIYIDIFPLDKCPKNELSGKIFFKSVEVLTCAIRGKVSKNFVCGYTKFYARVLYNFLKCLPKCWLVKFREVIRIVVGWFCSGRILCTVDGAHGYPGETYRQEWFAGSVFLDFEGEKYPAPVGWHELLTNMYGDYMQPPNEAERTGHFISWERDK